LNKIDILKTLNYDKFELNSINLYKNN